MSLSSALSTAVSGLTAQSRALAAISENIANASTTAYKTKETDFQALVSGAMSSATSTSSVRANSFQALSVQGQIASSTVDTNMAIDGSGYFVVAAGPNGTAAQDTYSRNGSFAPDANGYLVNSEGYYLKGFPTDNNGTVTTANVNDLTSLQTINTASISGTAKATSTISMSAALPADAVVGDAFPASMELYDSLGVTHSIAQTWTKTGDNAWTLTLADPTLASDPTVTSGTVSPASIAVTFNPDGSLGTTNPDPISLSISGFTTGAADSTIALSLGTLGATDGLTQYASTSSTLKIENPTFDQNGANFGQLSGISIDKKGLVTATFDNGLSMPIFQIPIATFSNPNGLTQVSGTVYDENADAGQVHLNLPTDGGAGAVVASALEGSATDVATEFNKMIIAQQAYSAASQVVTTTKGMFDTLMQAVR
jgi:flagellar hook protein FlgE